MARRDIEVFERTAAGYARLRPGYPPALVDWVVGQQALGPSSHLLEVGCGPGMATEAFAALGAPLLAIDNAEAMLEAARARLRAADHVTFERARFETWEGPREPVDLVFMGMAWHWLPIDVRDARTASWLKPEGALAICVNWPCAPWAPAKALYAKHWPQRPPRPFLDPDARVARERQALEEAGVFTWVDHAMFPVQHRYTADVYPDVLDTYSDHIDLPPAIKAPLYEAVRATIEAEGGELVREYVSVVMLARPRGGLAP